MAFASGLTMDPSSSKYAQGRVKKPEHFARITPDMLALAGRAIIGGDALVKRISAASILAKVTRDRLLLDLHQVYPVYGFDAHSGYGTPQHLAALFEHGPCEHHRRSFAPVREAHARLGLPVRLPDTVPVVLPSLRDDAFEGALDDASGNAFGDGAPAF